MADTITVVYGEEKFFPKMAQGFTLGPFSYTTEVRPNETPKEAIKRANKVLASVANTLFVAKRNTFFERLESTTQK
jgi:hypothetical protein